MTPAKLDRLAGQVLELEELEAALKDAIEKLEKEHAIDQLKASKKAAADEAERLREQLSSWWAGEYTKWLEDCEAGVERPLPERPERLSFGSRNVVRVVDPDLVPRAACAPVAKLLKPGMAGTEQVCTYFARIAQPKGERGT